MPSPAAKLLLLTQTSEPPADLYGQEVHADDPVLWARANGNAYDEEGGPAGSLFGTVYGTSVLPALSSAQSFSCDGVDDYVQVTNAAISVTAPITIEAWAIPSSTSAGFHQIAGTANYCIERSGNTFTLYTQGSSSLIGTTTITAGQVYHVVGVWNGTTAVLYVNGVQDNTYSPVVAAASNVLRIGSYNGSSEFWPGRVAEVAFYNRALTATRIAAHYTAGSTVAGAVTGTGALDAVPATVSATGTAAATGTGALAAAVATLAGSGTLRVTGTGSATATPATATATGALHAIGSGSLAATPATLAGAGTSRLTGAGSLTATPATVSGSGTSTVTGAGSLAATPATMSGSGTQRLTGTGGLTATPATVSGAGIVTEPGIVGGTGALTGPTVGMSGAGTLALIGAGQLTAQAATLAASALMSLAGSGGLGASPAGLAGSGVVTALEPSVVTGSGALVAATPTLSGASSLGNPRDLTVVIGPGRSPQTGVTASSPFALSRPVGNPELAAAGRSPALTLNLRE